MLSLQHYFSSLKYFRNHSADLLFDENEDEARGEDEDEPEM